MAHGGSASSGILESVEKALAENEALRQQLRTAGAVPGGDAIPSLSHVNGTSQIQGYSYLNGTSQAHRAVPTYSSFFATAFQDTSAPNMRAPAHIDAASTSTTPATMVDTGREQPVSQSRVAAEALQRYAQKAFERVDANRDGVLDRDEFQRHLSELRNEITSRSRSPALSADAVSSNRAVPAASKGMDLAAVEEALLANEKLRARLQTELPPSLPKPSEAATTGAELFRGGLAAELERIRATGAVQMTSTLQRRASPPRTSSSRSRPVESKSRSPSNEEKRLALDDGKRHIHSPSRRDLSRDLSRALPGGSAEYIADLQSKLWERDEEIARLKGELNRSAKKLTEAIRDAEMKHDREMDAKQAENDQLRNKLMRTEQVLEAERQHLNFALQKLGVRQLDVSM